MRTLGFSVDGQKLTKSGDFSDIIKGTKGYLKCRFDILSEDWIECKTVVVFETRNDEYAVPLNIDRTCLIPEEVTSERHFKVKVVGVGGTNFRITTNKVLITQKED